MGPVTNEILLVATIAIGIGAMVAFRTIGFRAYPAIVMFMCMVAISLFGAKLVEVFGFTTNIGNGLYAVVMMAQALNYELRGRDYAIKEIGLVALALTVFFGLTQSVAAMIPAESSVAFSGAVEAVVAAQAFAFPASLAAFYIAMTAFVALYDRLAALPSATRYIAACLVAQAVDSAIFFSVLFALSGFALTAEIMATGFVIKVAFAAITAPVLSWLKRP